MLLHWFSLSSLFESFEGIDLLLDLGLKELGFVLCCPDLFFYRHDLVCLVVSTSVNILTDRCLGLRDRI